LNYVPVVMVYFSYGAIGLIDVTRDLWIKESLSLTPSQLAGIAVWLTLPWTVKMVFGELVDTVPSQAGFYGGAVDRRQVHGQARVVPRTDAAGNQRPDRPPDRVWGDSPAPDPSGVCSSLFCCIDYFRRSSRRFPRQIKSDEVFSTHRG
jgi:hypothetical protein